MTSCSCGATSRSCQTRAGSCGRCSRTTPSWCVCTTGVCTGPAGYACHVTWASCQVTEVVHDEGIWGVIEAGLAEVAARVRGIGPGDIAALVAAHCASLAPPQAPQRGGGGGGPRRHRHALVPCEPDRRVLCDLCGVGGSGAAGFASCRACNYDECPRCAAGPRCPGERQGGSADGSSGGGGGGGGGGGSATGAAGAQLLHEGGVVVVVDGDSPGSRKRARDAGGPAAAGGGSGGGDGDIVFLD